MNVAKTIDLSHPNIAGKDCSDNNNVEHITYLWLHMNDKVD